MNGVVAIHQPNFFPWLGYFDKIARADHFVFLDAVDYPRSGSGGMGSWTNRVRIDVQGQAQWLTCPVRKLALGSPISAAMIDDSRDWRGKMSKTLTACYGRSPSFRRAFDLITELLAQASGPLADFNIMAIMRLASELGIATQFHRQSSLNHTGKGTELLISLVKGVGGTTYLAGGGAAGYQDDDLFGQAGIELVYQGFQPLPYGPTDSFIPGLSVIDYLMKDGRRLGAAA